jgi:hypothetical protein
MCSFHEGDRLLSLINTVAIDHSDALFNKSFWVSCANSLALSSQCLHWVDGEVKRVEPKPR